jgi:hypothetical protein
MICEGISKELSPKKHDTDALISKKVFNFITVNVLGFTIRSICSFVQVSIVINPVAEASYASLNCIDILAIVFYDAA